MRFLFPSMRNFIPAVVTLAALFTAALLFPSVGLSAEGVVMPERAGLSPAQWKQMEQSVQRGLGYIARTQSSDGSFEAPTGAQPAVTSLAVMAFLSRGYMPSSGPYAEEMTRAIDFVLGCQRPDGMLAISVGKTYRPNYNHAIAGVMLGEVYGVSSPDQRARIRTVILRALEYSRIQQTTNKRNRRDMGGVRYVIPWGPNDSDLTATAWHLMFFRSARNAEFEIPEQYIADAMNYVHRCFDPSLGGFAYALALDSEHYCSGGTVGSGVVALSLAGEHNTPEARRAGQWILDHPFDRYNRRDHPDDRYHYSAYYCSQAMFQLGGEYWTRFFPGFMQTLTNNQNSDGSWDRESKHDGRVGQTYTTALAVLSLTPPYQLLPIYQR